MSDSLHIFTSEVTALIEFFAHSQINEFVLKTFHCPKLHGLDFMPEGVPSDIFSIADKYIF